METLGNAILLNSAQKFYCKCCDYGTSRKSSYDDHILSAKHQKRANGNILETLGNAILLNSAQKICCEKCLKEFKNRSGLWKHKKKCDFHDNIVMDSKQTNNNVIPIDHASLTEKMIELVMSKNQEFMNVFMEKIVHILPSITNNTNTNSLNTNNNQFNIQMFLNDHCKNAMNISDFIKSLPLTAQHYENTKDNGLADTLTNLMVDGLNNLDVVERPIHCTDQKRKVMYVKDNNKWEKDTNNDIVTKNVKDLTILHRMNLDMWQEKNPKFNTDEDLQIAFSTIFSNLYADIIDERKGISKLMKGVIDATYLDDNTKKGFSKCDTLVSA